MNNTLTKFEYDEIKKLVECALAARNKKEAEKYLAGLKHKLVVVSGPARNVLGELWASTSEASGQVSDKLKKEKFCQMDLFKLEMFIEK